MTHPHWYILGAGSIGQLWACALVEAGYEVTLILRTEARVHAFMAQGKKITLRRNLKTQNFAVNAITADGCKQIDYLLCTTKSYDTAPALASVSHALSPNSQVLVVQNGLQGQEEAKRLLTGIPLWVGSSTDGAWRSGDWEVTHAGIGDTRIGPYNLQTKALHSSRGSSSLLTLNLLSLIDDSDICSTLWRKLAINCAINPLTVIFDCQNGDLLNDEPLALMTQVCEEIECLAQALNINLFSQPLIEQAKHIAQLTAENHSSMLQDYRSQRPTELEAMTGYLLTQANQLGIELPINQQVYKAVRKVTQV